MKLNTFDFIDAVLPFAVIVMSVSLAVALVVTVVCEAGVARGKSASECPHCGKEVRLVAP